MARSLKSYTDPVERDKAIRRRIKDGAGGLGTMAAMDAAEHLKKTAKTKAAEAPLDAVEPALPAKSEETIEAEEKPADVAS